MCNICICISFIYIQQIYTNMSICIWLYLNIYIYMCVHIHIYMYTCIYTYIYIHTRVYAYIYIYIHIYTYICVFISTYKLCVCRCRGQPFQSWVRVLFFPPFSGFPFFPPPFFCVFKLLEEGKAAEAIMHAKIHFPRYFGEHAAEKKEILQLMGCVAYMKRGLLTSPCELFRM